MFVDAPVTQSYTPAIHSSLGSLHALILSAPTMAHQVMPVARSLYGQSAVVNPAAAPSAAVVATSFLPATMTIRTGVCRNFYILVGPITANGAKPLDVFPSLLGLPPNHGLFSTFVKDALHEPADFSFLIDTS